MAQERPSRWTDWVQAVRTQAPIARDHLGHWIDAVREEPALVWQTAAVRYAVYILVALLAGMTVRGVIQLPTPPLPPNARSAATTADFFCLCSNPSCGRRFTIHREFGFDDFPVVCPACKRPSGMQARACNSPTCKGAWIIPVQKEEGSYCSVCGAKLE